MDIREMDMREMDMRETDISEMECSVDLLFGHVFGSFFYFFEILDFEH